MNCTICGAPYIIGQDIHGQCKIVEDERAERDERIDALLRLHSDEIDELLGSKSTFGTCDGK